MGFLKSIVGLWVVLSLGNVWGQDARQMQDLSWDMNLWNPALAGWKNTHTISLRSKLQWLSLNEFPHQEFISADGVLGATSFTYGAMIQHDQFGPSGDFLVKLSTGYKLRTSAGLLAFGLRGGILHREVNTSALYGSSVYDPSLAGLMSNTTFPVFDFGVSFIRENLILGVSWLGVLGNYIQPEDFLNSASIYHQNTIVLLTSYSLVLSDQWVFIPQASVITDFQQNNGLYIEANVQYKKWFRFGVSYNTPNYMGITTTITAYEKFRVGIGTTFALMNGLNNRTYYDFILAVDLTGQKNKLTKKFY